MRWLFEMEPLWLRRAVMLSIAYAPFAWMLIVLIVAIIQNRKHPVTKGHAWKLQLAYVLGLPLIGFMALIFVVLTMAVYTFGEHGLHISTRSFFLLDLLRAVFHEDVFVGGVALGFIGAFFYACFVGSITFRLLKEDFRGFWLSQARIVLWGVIFYFPLAGGFASVALARWKWGEGYAAFPLMGGTVLTFLFGLSLSYLAEGKAKRPDSYDR